MDGESLRLLLDQGVSVEQIAKRFGKHPSTVAYWMKKHGLEAPNRERHAAKGGIERERLEALVADGKTIAEIAQEVELSASTVRYWMMRYDIRTRHRRGRQQGQKTRDARDAGIAVLKLHCVHHGESEFIIEGRGYYRCKRCRADSVARRRRKVKAILVEEAGGSCCICGYDRYVGALEFHHVDPREKRLEMSRNGVTLSLAAMRAEAQKCVLLCSNCHAEVENGMTSLPGTVVAGLARGGPNTPEIRGSSTGRAFGC